jgi:hypothetical protein
MLMICTHSARAAAIASPPSPLVLPVVSAAASVGPPAAASVASLDVLPLRQGEELQRLVDDAPLELAPDEAVDDGDEPVPSPPLKDGPQAATPTTAAAIAAPAHRSTDEGTLILDTVPPDAVAQARPLSARSARIRR